MSQSLITPETRIKVSSVLNRDTTTFGKQHLIDGSEETCWNSEQGLPQHILVDFGGSPVTVESVQFTFQGGFVGKKCTALASLPGAPNDYCVDLGAFYPQDINPTQTFPLACPDAIQRLKIIFEESTDFYGRITVYKMDILGTH
ncbi:galactose-binding domain-like protein [Fennellomyces sp. T-0311]|nr:galactose-binding domain-like protein [Fennellomyces sp. T-0311]